jgi:membrane protease YdiL (CAAX protease family)
MSFWDKVLIKSAAVFKAALGLGFFICTAYIIFSIFDFLKIDRKVYEGTYNMVFCLASFAVMFIIHKISSFHKEPLFKVKKLSPDQVAAIIIVGLGMLGLVATYINIVNLLAESRETVSEAMEEYRDNVDRFSDVPQTVIPVWDSILYVFNICFIVPVIEEMTFRGVVFGQLRREFSPLISIVLSAFAFGIMHGISIHIGYAFACGVIIATCYHLTDSLIAPVILHSVFNIFGSGIPTFMSIEELGIPGEITSSFSYGIHISSMLFMPISVLAIAYLVNIKRKKAKEAAELEKALQTGDGEEQETEISVEENVLPADDGSEAAS